MRVVQRLSDKSRVDDVERRARRIFERADPSDPDAIQLAVACLDLTTLEETDDDAIVRGLADQARRAGVAALCTWGRLVPAAVDALAGTRVEVASVAGGFPWGTIPLEDKVAEIEDAISAGATEIDAVIDRRPLGEGRDAAVYEEIERFRAACGDARLKVIVESGELGSARTLRRATLIALEAGADLVKTSTGKTATGATPGAVLTIAEAVRDFSVLTGRRAGVKVSGGVRTPRDAAGYVALVAAALDEPIGPDRFRIGASSLLDRLLNAGSASSS